MNIKKLLSQILMLLLPGVLYLLLMALPVYEQQIQIYILILIPQFCIYFYIIWQIFHHESDLPPLSWFLIFAGFYRLIFTLSFIMIPRLYELAPLGFNQAGQPPSSLIVLTGNWPGGAMFYWRIVLLLLEAMLGFLLYDLLKYFGISTYRLLIVLLNPLWIIEIFRNGHDQVIAILLLWLAVRIFYLKYDWKALLPVLISFFVSVVPILTFLPFLYKKFRPMLLILLSGAALVIFICSFMEQVPSYHFIFALDRPAFNGFFISAGISLLNCFNLSGEKVVSIDWFGNSAAAYTQAEFYMLVLIAAVLLAVLITQIKKLELTADFRSINYLQSSYIICGALLLVSPVFQPWHLLWILPFIIFLPNWSWLIFTVLVQVSYFISRDYAPADKFIDSGWILYLVQFIPFYILLIAEYMDKRRAKGWF